MIWFYWRKQEGWIWSSYHSSLEVIFLGWGKSALKKEGDIWFSEVNEGGESHKYILEDVTLEMWF